MQSQDICGAVKAGRLNVLEKAADYIKNLDLNGKDRFFNENVTLVPVPRSSPITSGALWPAKEIATALLKANLAKEIHPCIERTSPVKKSSAQAGADTRPSVQDHFESFTINKGLIVPDVITLVDDVLTLGRTFYACYQRLQEVYPSAEIRCFAMIRTMSLVPEIENLVDPSIDIISYNPVTGKTTRNP